MIDFVFDRRDFLRIGSIGAGMSVAGFSDYAFAQQSEAYKDKSVVWV